MKKIIAIIVIVAVAALVYKYSTRTTDAPQAPVNQVENSTTTADLEREAAAIDLSGIEADFGAELNVAVE